MQCLFNGFVGVSAFLLITAAAQAQNLFEVDTGSGNIYEFTPGGVRSTFTSGLNYPFCLSFNNEGNLFVGEEPNAGGSIIEITPGGVQSNFAPGLESPGLAFNSAGDLFVVGGDSVYEFTNNAGTLSSNAVTFASGLDDVVSLAFNSAGNLFVGYYRPNRVLLIYTADRMLPIPKPSAV